jgi:hypothetical protein
MSLHTDISGREQNERGETCWRGRCACGWNGEQHDGSGTYDLARRDYRAHIEEALGAAAYYEACVGCLNCGYAGSAGVLIGTDVWSGTCPRCGAKGRLRPNNDFYREEQERWVRR